MAGLDRYLTYLHKQGGSDLHLAAGLGPRLRRGGHLLEITGSEPLSDEALRQLLQELPSQEQWRQFEATGDLDFAYELPGVARYRANFFEQHRGIGAVFRLIEEKIRDLASLDAPEVLRRIAMSDRGLVLITGPTGSGKSTTMAAMIHEINTHRRRHIVTIEDPVEFVHTNRESVFSHREVHRDTDSFAGAVRAAIRQDPDVIVVGEMRDPETIAMALRAAEMGVLVFGTLHTNSVAKTLDRLVDAFPTDEHEQVRESLADAIGAIVAQLLIPTADGAGRCAAHEILVRTQGLGNIIRQGNTSMIRSVIQSGKRAGMQSMDDALDQLVKAGRISQVDALRRCTDTRRFSG